MRLDTPPKFAVEIKHRIIHIANSNIRHHKPKIYHMKILLDHSNSVDFFGLCETFLNDSIDNSLVQINGYNFERKYRNKTNSNFLGKRGGILVYVA